MRTIYDEDQLAFGKMVERLLREEVVPLYPDWEEAGNIPREFWIRAGELGLLGMQIPERFGGGGVSTFKFNVMLTEQLNLAGTALGVIRLHNDVCTPYFLRYTTDEQKERWLPGIADGTLPTAIAMSEPGAGSDLAGISTVAKRKGDVYVVNGSKTFISNGYNADLVITAVRTDPKSRRSGISLMVIEQGMAGFERGRKLKKIGLKAQDTVELFFSDVEVPVANLLGEEGRGFEYLTSNLPQERLSIAINSQFSAERALAETVDYVKERKAFGQQISSFQNTKFQLADCATEIAAGAALAERAIEQHDLGELGPADAAMVKLYCTELQGRVIDRCLQLHGGYGYILEQSIARAYADARVARIYGGSSEIMKTIISKSLGLSER